MSIYLKHGYYESSTTSSTSKYLYPYNRRTILDVIYGYKGVTFVFTSDDGQNIIYRYLPLH